MATPNDSILDTDGQPLEDEGEDLALAEEFVEMAKAMPVVQRRAAIALANAEKSGNQAALPALRLLVDDFLPILADLVINCGSNFEALDEVLSEGEDDEDGAPGGPGEDDGGVDPEQVEVLYRTVRMMHAFVEQLVASGVLKNKPKAKEAADNLLGMLKGLAIAGAGEGFVEDEGDKKIADTYAAAFAK